METVSNRHLICHEKTKFFRSSGLLFWFGGRGEWKDPVVLYDIVSSFRLATSSFKMDKGILSCDYNVMYIYILYIYLQFTYLYVYILGNKHIVNSLMFVFTVNG